MYTNSVCCHFPLVLRYVCLTKRRVCCCVLTVAADATQGLPTRADAGQTRVSPQRTRLATVSAPQRRPTDTVRRHDGDVRRDSLARAARGESGAHGGPICCFCLFIM